MVETYTLIVEKGIGVGLDSVRLGWVHGGWFDHCHA